MVNVVNKVFGYNDFKDARGGTELMVSQLLKYVDNDLLSKFDIIVASPPQDFVRGDKPTILYIHDWYSDPSFDILKNTRYQNNFDYFVFVSYTQKELFRLKFGLPYYKCVVIKNAIEPTSTFENIKWSKVEKIKILYSSSPHKGIHLAYEVFKEISKEFGDKVELNVYSNFATYGKAHLSRNAPYESIFDEMKAHPQINYFGSVDHDVLLEETKDQHIWFHPSTFPETSAISLLEAASAECLLVCNDLGALPETSAGFGVMFKYDDDINKHAQNAYTSLFDSIHTIIEGKGNISQYVALQKIYFDTNYSWEKRAKEWEDLLNSFFVVG